MKYWKFIICEGLLWSHKCWEWDWNWKVLWNKYHKTPFLHTSCTAARQPHGSSSHFITHKKCQVHLCVCVCGGGGVLIIVSQMQCQSFYITPHLEQRCIRLSCAVSWTWAAAAVGGGVHLWWLCLHITLRAKKNKRSCDIHIAKLPLNKTDHSNEIPGEGAFPLLLSNLLNVIWRVIPANGYKWPP